VLAADATPPDGGAPGSSLEFLQHDLLDRYSVDIALLTSVEAAISGMSAADANHSAVMIAAFNDFILDHWTSDSRLRYALCVTPQDAELAVAEIKRHGSDPRVAAIYLPMFGARMGNRRFYPVYAAASELALPIVVHPAGGESVYVGSASFAVAAPELFTEFYSDWGSLAQSQVTSLVMHGVFERFPQLKVMFIEWGFGFVVPHLWTLDKTWRQLRLEVPWVTRWPSEYVREHITFTSQPIVEPRKNGRDDNDTLIRLIEDTELRDVLVYSSDYPHWDNDRPGTVLQGLSQETRDKVYCRNAEAVLRL
jgi:predicted TIM-barrel fold metal-dependent hydrolase